MAKEKRAITYYLMLIFSLALTVVYALDCLVLADRKINVEIQLVSLGFCVVLFIYAIYAFIERARYREYAEDLGKHILILSLIYLSKPLMEGIEQLISFYSGSNLSPFGYVLITGVIVSIGLAIAYGVNKRLVVRKVIFIIYLLIATAMLACALESANIVFVVLKLSLALLVGGLAVATSLLMDLE